MTLQNKMAAPKLRSVLVYEGSKEGGIYVTVQEIRATFVLSCGNSICKAVQGEMLGFLWDSYLRVEPGKTCCSHGRFQ